MHSIFHSSGIREINFVLTNSAIYRLKNEWKEFVLTIEDYPSFKFKEKGIVMCAGGVRYFTCAWIAIHNLRSTGCNLPIELWYLDNELNEEITTVLEAKNVFCKRFSDYVTTNLRGVMLKPLAILHSQFKEVLFLDADNNCLSDPSLLFDSTEYKQFGAVFWPDYWQTSPNNPIWRIIENEDRFLPEQESGQILINKELCWKEINLCLFFNEKHLIFHKLLFGDKDTFKFAWLALNSRFHMIKNGVATCGHFKNDGSFFGHTMIQYDLSSNILFLHRNLLKWDITKPNEYAWKKIRWFHPDAMVKKYISKKYSMNLAGDYQESDVCADLVNLETSSLKCLQTLRETDFYTRFLIYSRIRQYRHD